MIAHHKPSILLVDDEPDILFSLTGLLRREFHVYVAEGGRVALEFLKERPVDVIVTDQRMPGMTGVELLARSRELCPDAIPILFTGYADLKAVVDAINVGRIFRYITKPWDPDDLVDILREAATIHDRLAEQKKLLGELHEFVTQAIALANEQCAASDDSSGAAEQLVRHGNELLEQMNRLAIDGAPAGEELIAARDAGE